MTSTQQLPTKAVRLTAVWSMVQVKGGWRKRRFSLRAGAAKVSGLFSRGRRRYG